MRTSTKVILVTLGVLALLAAFVVYANTANNWQNQNQGGTVTTVGTYVPASIPTTPTTICSPGYSTNPNCPDFVPPPTTTVPGNSGNTGSSGNTG